MSIDKEFSLIKDDLLRLRMDHQRMIKLICETLLERDGLDEERVKKLKHQIQYSVTLLPKQVGQPLPYS